VHRDPKPGKMKIYGAILHLFIFSLIAISEDVWYVAQFDVMS
jgi:hypothetical protein